jgi:hypothetical protein
MHQSELNRCVARALGEEVEFIARRGFSLETEILPQEEDELLAHMVDWDQLQTEQATALFPDREAHTAA